jgi:hypothetical protein
MVFRQKNKFPDGNVWINIGENCENNVEKGDRLRHQQANKRAFNLFHVKQ